SPSAARRADGGPACISPWTSWPAARSASATTGPAKPPMPVTRTRTAALRLQPVEVGAHHHLDEALERDRRRPAEDRARLRRVADQQVDLRRPEERRVLADVLPPVEADAAERDVDELL